MALLEVHNLVKIYGKRAVVNGVSFEVNQGEVVGLLGPNGAGKTTSFRMTTGQIQPNDGQVIFNGEDVSYLPMYKRARLGMGYLSQEQSVFRKLTVEQNILAILEALPYSRSLGRRLRYRERVERTEQVLARFNLLHVRTNVAGRCSGGEKRRLEIARCLVCEPLLILLDEPFAAVDPMTTEDIRHNIRELAEHGIGILLTDHNVREVLKITDRSYLIKEGKVVTHGTPPELIRDPIAIQEYLGTSFVQDGLSVMSATPSSSTARPSSETIAPLADEVPEAIPVIQHYGMEQVLEDEKTRRLVEQLTDLEHAQDAANALAQKGMYAVPALVEALERRDVLMRERAFHVLHHLGIHLLGFELQFDPDAPEEVRRRQLFAIRDGWERKAG